MSQAVELGVTPSRDGHIQPEAWRGLSHGGSRILYQRGLKSPASILAVPSGLCLPGFGVVAAVGRDLRLRGSYVFQTPRCVDICF